MPAYDADIRQYAIKDGMYRRETRFYQELAMSSHIPVPNCYYAELDNESGNFILILEDLSHLRAGDELAGCSVDEVAHVVRGLARLHAAWWNNEKIESFNWIRSPNSNPVNLQEMYLEAWTKTSETLSRIFPPDTFEISKQLGSQLAATLQTANTGAHTLNHGDAHLGNIFFGTDEFVLLDWQNLTVSSPALDIAYFIQGSLPEESRRVYERELLDIYLATLNNHGVSDYSLERLIEDYRFGLLRSLIPSVLSVANLGMENHESLDLIETVGARMVAIADWDCGELISGS